MAQARHQIRQRWASTSIRPAEIAGVAPNVALEEKSPNMGRALFI
jgi:hypothetical protein